MTLSKASHFSMSLLPRPAPLCPPSLIIRHRSSFLLHPCHPKRTFKRHCAPSCLHYIPFIHSQRYYSTLPPALEAEAEPTSYTFEDVRLLSNKPDPNRLIIDVRELSELQQTGRVPGALNIPITSNPDAFYLSDDDFLDRFGFEKPRLRSTAPGKQEGRNGNKAGGTGKSPYTPEMKDRETHAGLNAGGIDSSGQGSMSETGATTQGSENGKGQVDEVIFYCKAGVRSRAAAKMAREWYGVKVGDMSGGWDEWSSRGGSVQK